VRPEDVALATEEVDGISIRNQIQGRVMKATPHDGQVWVEIDIGAPLIVRVSRQAFEEMSIDVDRPVWCLIKVSAIDYLEASATAGR